MNSIDKDMMNKVIYKITESTHEILNGTTKFKVETKLHTTGDRSLKLQFDLLVKWRKLNKNIVIHRINSQIFTYCTG